jgi:hypothetical protein
MAINHGAQLVKLLLLTLGIILVSSTLATAQVLLEESFENVEFPPSGWTETPVEVAGYGIDPDWDRHEGVHLNSYNPLYGSIAHDGNFVAYFNSRIASGWCASARLETPPIDLSSAASADLSYWMFHDLLSGWGDCWEAITVQVDPGTGVWEDLGEHNVRQVTESPGWTEMILTLDAYTGLPEVRIGFLAVSDQGEDMQLDLVTVTVMDADNQAPQIQEIAGSRMPVSAPLDLFIVMTDRSLGAEELDAMVSFDGFASSTNFSMSLISEATAQPPLRRFRYQGLVPSPASPSNGLVRIQLADEHGNLTLSDDIPVEWYTPLGTLNEDFESHEDFTGEIPPFTQIDADSSGTWGIPYATFPNDGYVGSFIVFNPYATVPAVPYANYLPHSGQRCAVAFTAFSGNDDWLVSPAMDAASDLSFSFWARTPDTSWDLERFRVMVSTTNNHDPEAFELVPSSHYVPGENFVEPPFAWTRYEFDLSAWAAAPDGYVFVAINGISPWITLVGLFVDDLEIQGSTSGVGFDLPVLSTKPVAHPNPFNPRTSIAFDLASPSTVELQIHDLRGRMVKKLMAGFLQSGHHEVIWDGTNDQGRNLSSGTYLVQLKSTEGIRQNKLVLIR